MFSHYVWRGFALTDRFAFQPSVFVSTHGLTFTSWSSWSSTGVSTNDDHPDNYYPGCYAGVVPGDTDCPVLREHDFTVDYTKPVGSATVSVGYINYLFPGFRTARAKENNQVGATNELYAGVTFTAPANPFVKFYFDVDGNDIDTSKGTYMQFGVSQPIPLGESKLTLTPMGSVAYNWGQSIADGGCDFSDPDSGANCWNDANLGVKLAIPVGKFTITPAMYLSIGLNDTVRAIGYGDDRDPADTKFYGGVSFSYAFSGSSPPSPRLWRAGAACLTTGAPLYCSAGSRGGPADVRTTPLRRRPSRPARRVRAGPGHLDPAFLQYRRRLPVHVPAGHAIPRPIASALAFGGTRVAYWTLRGTRAAVADNYRGAFPDLSPSADRRADAAHVPQLLSDVLDLFRSVSMPQEQALELFEDWRLHGDAFMRAREAARASSSSPATSATGRSAAR